jgi:hypothetical protein
LPFAAVPRVRRKRFISRPARRGILFGGIPRTAVVFKDFYAAASFWAVIVCDKTGR